MRFPWLRVGDLNREAAYLHREHEAKPVEFSAWLLVAQ